MAEDNRARLKGSKIDTARYMAASHDGRRLTYRWHRALMETAICSIEHDMVPAKLEQKLTLAFKGQDQDAPDSTHSKKVSVGDRSIRSCGANAMGIAFGVLAVPEHYRLLCGVTRLTQPFEDSHGDALRRGDSVKGFQQWHLGFVRGEFMATVHQTL